MEDQRSKGFGKNAEKETIKKKKKYQEKKSWSDLKHRSRELPLSMEPEGKMLVIGKSCKVIKSGSQDAGYALHDCKSEMQVNPVLSDVSLKHATPHEIHSTHLVATVSSASFKSAISDVSNSDQLHKKIKGLEEEVRLQNMTIHNLKKQLSKQRGVFVTVNTVSTNTEEGYGTVVEEYKLKLKEMENDAYEKSSKIVELNKKIEHCCALNFKQMEENRGLTHEVNLLNRQLQSLYELLGTKNWDAPIDAAEFNMYRNKTRELEGLLVKQENVNKELQKKIDSYSLDLEDKENQLVEKDRDLVQYKNRTTLELCKLINQIDCLEREAKSQTRMCNVKIMEAQNSMDDELVEITQKLEEQYQKDTKSTIEKYKLNFERLSTLPTSSIEKLLQLCEPNKLDVVSLQKEWDFQRKKLECQLHSKEEDHNKQIIRIKEIYEGKISSLKNQLELLSAQLIERKEILDSVQKELMVYKSNSSMRMSRIEDINSLKELYTTELLSQKQVHKLEMNVFEEKVKTLSEEIIYHARNEEVQMRELEKTKQMAYTFREKYQKLVIEWEEKLEKDLRNVPNDGSTDNSNCEVITAIDEFKVLIDSLKKEEADHDEKLRELQNYHDDEICVYKREIEVYKDKLQKLELFQKTQAKLDGTIQDLIRSIGINYSKTVEAIVTSHVAEMSFKDIENDKINLDELESFKNIQDEEVIGLRNRVICIEKSKSEIQNELDILKSSCNFKELQAMKSQIEEVTAELLKYQGMMTVKDEKEVVLNERVQELENMVKEKEENCQKNIESLMAKFIEVKVLSSAKEELVKELEDKLSESEKFLERSCREVDKLYGICSLLEENMKKVERFCRNDGGDFKKEEMSGDQVFIAKNIIENLKSKFIDTFEKIECWEEKNFSKEAESIALTKVSEAGILEKNKKLEQSLITAKEVEFKILEKNKFLEECLVSAKASNLAFVEERKKALEENKKLTQEKKILSESMAKKEEIIETMKKEKEEFMRLKEESRQRMFEQEQIKKQLKDLESERGKLLNREKLVTAERDEVVERNEALEEKVRALNERMEVLVRQLANSKSADGDGILSISLQEYRVLYQEEEAYSEMERNPSASTLDYQGDSSMSESENVKNAKIYNELYKVNEELKKENEYLKKELRGKDIEFEYKVTAGQAADRLSFQEDMLSKFKNIQNELSEVISDRNRLLTISESLEKERNYLKEEVDNLRQDNYACKASFEAKIKILADKAGCSFAEDASLKEIKMNEMKKEIGKLSDYIKTLSDKLDVMKANNENLLSKTNEHLKHNQNLINELEEAWTERYEIEDQLSKVRRENALLNLHRTQLEETNRRISSLVAEGKPSVVSWIKLHETVENIVDEVLALKMSSSESNSNSSSVLDIPRSPSDIKLMKETLHVQLQNKTILCDELIVQKKTLEKELLGLENLLKQSDSRIFTQKKSNSEFKSVSYSDSQHKQLTFLASDETSEETDDQETSEGVKKTFGENNLLTLNLLKKHFEHQTEKTEAHFRESLVFEIEGLKKIQKFEDNLIEQNKSLGDLTTVEGRTLESLKIKYQDEILQLTKEFEREVKKLRINFPEISNNENSHVLSEDVRKQYESEIENLRAYFERKWSDLEKRYHEVFTNPNHAMMDSALEDERCEIVKNFLEVFQHHESDDSSREIKLKNFLNDVLNRYINEIKRLKQKHREDLSDLEVEHQSEIEKLQSVICRIQEDLSASQKVENEKVEDSPEGKQCNREDELEKENKKLNLLLEETKRNHDKEILTLEEFWTEKLSDCETRCAIIKATVQQEKEMKKESECEVESNHSVVISGVIDDCQEGPESSKMKENRLEKARKDRYSEEVENFEKKYIKNTTENFGEEQSCKRSCHKFDEEKRSEYSFCTTCLSNTNFLEIMEVKTDDDKLEIVRERDSLREMVSSLRHIVAKLLNFVNRCGKELQNASFRELENDETMYKSIQLDGDQSVADLSKTSNNFLSGVDLSTIIQEINDHSLLNSSDKVRCELDKCMKQLKEDANNILSLSHPETFTRNHLYALVKKIEMEKSELENKVHDVEEMQDMIKKELGLTKDRLSQWERNLEVISEGYGEEVVEPKKTISLTELKDKIKLFLTEHSSQSSQEMNFFEEIFQEGDFLKDEWKKEKSDLQQQERCQETKRHSQVDVADKQLNSLRKFLEEQATERELEREAFDKEINNLKESLKAKERDYLVQTRTNRECGPHTCLADKLVEALDFQLKELTMRLKEAEKNKSAVEGEFQNAVKKIWSLREVIQELEIQLAETSERESNLKKKIDKLEERLEDHSLVNTELKDELESCRSKLENKYCNHIKHLEDELTSLRRVADQVNFESINQMKSSLREIESSLNKKTKDLEQLHVSSANISCGSPSEDVSIRDQLDTSRCSSTDESFPIDQPENLILPLENIDRIQENLNRHTRAEEVAKKYIQDLKMQLRNNRRAFDEIQTERDVLLERVDTYLKENSSLKVRLEEQRCNAGLVQKQLNADLESRIIRLESDVEKLNELCLQKDKQLQDMKIILENTKKSLKVRETEVLNRSKEENVLVSTLKSDLANALNEKQKIEEALENMNKKFRETLKMPALIETMIEEKNAEIDRLEKELSRLSNEKMTEKNPSDDAKNLKRLRFSEPDSFGECISSISLENPSTLRNCSDSYTDFKDSSFKLRQPVQSSSKLESLSSIGPLQLSPRGTNLNSNRKVSSPVFLSCSESTPNEQRKSSSRKQDKSTETISEDCKLQKEIESKQREISELKLEIDILKRKLVEGNQELETLKYQSKEKQNDFNVMEEEIRKLKNNEKSLLMSIESLKKNYSEEVEELQNKLSFEYNKVEKVYEEIKALEIKKVEIEEAFLSLKDDYNEKINGDRETIETLSTQVKELEIKNCEYKGKLVIAKEEMEKCIKAAEEESQRLAKEISNLKKENKKLISKNAELSTSSRVKVVDAKIQVENELDLDIIGTMASADFELPKKDDGFKSFNDVLQALKKEFDKMLDVLHANDFKKAEVFSFAVSVKRLLHRIISNVGELLQELENHRKKVMECSVDDLAVKVQKELVLSEKLDNKLLSSLETNGLATDEVKLLQDSVGISGIGFKENGGGDNVFVIPKSKPETENLIKITQLYKESLGKITALETERLDLKERVKELDRVVKILEDTLSNEKQRVIQEKERCSEDAKIMELLRVNLEKSLEELRSKDRELKKEREMRIATEVESETLKKQKTADSKSKKVSDLNRQLECQKDKIVSIGRVLEEEKKKNQELTLELEQNKIDRVSERGTQKLLESEIALIREQNDHLKVELINARKLLNSRNMEIGLLKRKINLQEIDIKALSLSNDFHRVSSSEVSTLLSKTESLDDINPNILGKESMATIPHDTSPSSSLLLKMRKLNSCVRQHVQESNEMGEALLYLSQETQQMRDLIKKLEEHTENKVEDETLVPDLDLERKLWSLERDRLITDVEAIKAEYETVKRSSLEVYKNNEILKLENSKLKKDIKLLKKEVAYEIENGVLQDRIAHLIVKYMRVESYRKALAWQKQYLLAALSQYQQTGKEACEKIGKSSARRKDLKSKVQKSRGKFKIVSLTIIAIFRMRFIVKHRQRNKMSYVYSLLGRQTQTNNLAHNQVMTSVFNIYNEPVNPLSYQTQNIFRQSSAKVLRTPPSQDPGLHSFSVKNKKVPESLTFNYFQENTGTAKVLP